VPLLTFITDELLYQHTQKVLDVAENAVTDAEINLYSNKIDPFSALFDSLRQGISLSSWIEQEKPRQIQKTMQNAVGEFHEDILGSVEGWEKLPVGNVIDLRNRGKKIIAEVKNKYNTTKGNHKKDIYDDLKSQEEGEHLNYTGYYVEIVPSRKEPYDKPFTPPDNITHTRRASNEKIRVIDGKSFYALVSGVPDAIEQLYFVLPKVISDIMRKKVPPSEDVALYKSLFEKSYG